MRLPCNVRGNPKFVFPQGHVEGTEFLWNKVGQLKVVCLGKPLRKEVKSSSLHRPKGMQDPCKTHCFSPPFVLPRSLLCSPPAILLREYCFIPSSLRHRYHLTYTSHGNPLGPEHLQGVSSWSHSYWERNYHLLNHWGYPLLLAFLLPPPLCLSYLFILIRLPRLAERRLDIYSSLIFLTQFKVLQNQQRGHLTKPLGSALTLVNYS